MSYIINQDVPVGSALNLLGSLSDVNISNPSDGDCIVYNSTTGKWENSDALSTLNSALLKLLWANPDPTSDFASQTVNLSSSDYDFLLFRFRANKADANFEEFATVMKGKATTAKYVWYGSSGGASIYLALRDLTYQSDTVYKIANCGHLSLNASTGSVTTNNALLIPIGIYGYKKGV